MDTRTGEVYELQVGESADELAARLGVPSGVMKEITRDLSLQEKMSKQIGLYSPCGCGSGKKFKFCCHKIPAGDTK